MIDSIDQRFNDHIIGVIDLLDGRAVHAIAGARDRYLPVAFCDGDATALAEHYLGIGIKRLYVADLSALTGGTIQAEALKLLTTLPFDQFLFDTGWTGQESESDCQLLAEFVSQVSKVDWIAATESCQSTDSIATLANAVGADHTFLGLDFSDGQFISQGIPLEAWLDAANDLSLAGAILLDLAAVGTNCGAATARLCRNVKEAAPGLTIYSGGGVRENRDVAALLDAGCDAVLMATALYPAVRNSE